MAIHGHGGVTELIITRKIQYPAFTGTEERRLYIYLPIGYEAEPERRYPVLYMFDGHNVFFDSHATYGKSWGMGKYLDKTKTPLIVVAIECHHGENGERISEYSPFDFSEEDFGDVIGRGDETMQYYVQQLKPAIDKEFRTLTDREHTFVSGSSMGGLMALYAAFRYNHIFSRCAALSPSFFLCRKPMYEFLAKEEILPNTTVYMDVGTEEMSLEGGSAEGYAAFAAMLISRNVALTQRIIAGGEHCEASWERQIPIFMPVLLYELFEKEEDTVIDQV